VIEDGEEDIADGLKFTERDWSAFLKQLKFVLNA
jgi:hypothetical protein